VSRRERVSRGVHNSVLRTVVWDIIMLHESHPQSPPRAPRTRPSVDRCRDRLETIERTNGRRARGGVCWPRVQLLPTLPHRQTRFCPRNEGTRFPPFARSSASSFQIPNENVHLARFTVHTSSHVRHGKTTDCLFYFRVLQKRSTLPSTTTHPHRVHNTRSRRPSANATSGDVRTCMFSVRTTARARERR